MTNEELILERLDRIEERLIPLTDTAGSLTELKDDMTPLINKTVQILIEEFKDVESAFQLEDLMFLLKKGMRSIRYFTYALEQMENLVDLITTAEPLLRSTVPQLINYLDDMEQKGVFQTYAATLAIRAKFASEYSADDIDKIGDGLVAVMGVLQKFAEPESMAFLNCLAEIPGDLDLSECKGLGPVGMLTALNKGEVKDGLGVVMELTKALGKLKRASL
ncbi:MAG: DUF1641 domain-containing protein [Deltaproteobacteria bacterium]|nr:DUF1641 domain-containing protein [Deltaproteobacteria bacterium]